MLPNFAVFILSSRNWSALEAKIRFKIVLFDPPCENLEVSGELSESKRSLIIGAPAGYFN